MLIHIYNILKDVAEDSGTEVSGTTSPEDGKVRMLKMMMMILRVMMQR